LKIVLAQNRHTKIKAKTEPKTANKTVEANKPVQLSKPIDAEKHAKPGKSVIICKLLGVGKPAQANFIKMSKIFGFRRKFSQKCKFFTSPLKVSVFLFVIQNICLKLNASFVNVIENHFYAY
jgi:hypothetical protein